MGINYSLIGVFFVTFLGNLHAWSVNGTVRSQHNVAVSGVQVSVVDTASITGTTNAQGYFELNSQNTTPLQTSREPVGTLQYQLEGRLLTILHAGTGLVHLNLTNPAGQRVWNHLLVVENGQARIQLPENILHQPLYLSISDPVQSRQSLRRDVLLAAVALPRLRFQKIGFADTTYQMTQETETNVQIVLRELAPPPSSNFTQTVNGATFEMIYIPGGTFTLGCEAASCPADTRPVTGVSVSAYHISRTEVTRGLWQAVMGQAPGGFGTSSSSNTNLTWYGAMEFACRLSQLTGRRYRMTTEAEWEYAAKNHLSSLERVGTGEEWAYNTWSSTHSGGANPVGTASGQHTQKTRRDAQGTVDNITGRLIRSIEGEGPALRLAVSATMDYPPGMVAPCDLHAPQIGAEPVNSFRDPRWITGSDSVWATGSIALGSFDLRVWEDGTARLGSTPGQWFTSNNIALVFVPATGTRVKFAYIFLDNTQGSLISDQGFGFNSRGYIGRIVKQSATRLEKPAITGLMSGAQLAAAAGADFRMVDMVNIPQAARQKDPRLLEGTAMGWFQDNRSAGGNHHYRKDIDSDEFRFTVNQGGNRVMLANGDWFTVNNTFLRVIHSTGYTADYLYAIDANGTLYHNSFMAYERGDFRLFNRVNNNSDTLSQTCGSICIGEIPRGEGASLYARMTNGNSTFVPAPCPPGGCQ